MHRTAVLLSFWLFSTLACSCASKATDEEISRMCDRLLELRGKADDGEMKRSCMTEAVQEGVSQRQACCRIAAVNLQEYWHRCRTGEARKP